jgi:hypothetical protein
MALIEPASWAAAGAVVADRAGDGGWLRDGWIVVVGMVDDWSGLEGLVTMATFHVKGSG